MQRHSNLALVVTASALLATSGCTGEMDSGTAAGGTIALVGTGDSLLLAGSPLDAAYRASYPNPEGIDRMIVRVAEGGDLDVRCESAGAPADCSETPFFTDIDVLDRGMLRVRVWDVYGALVASERVASTEMAVRAPAPDDGDGYHTPDVVPDDGSGGETSTPDWGDGGSLDCPRPAEKARFCDGVNRRIAELGVLGYSFDCGSLPDSFSFEFPDIGAISDETPIRRCGDVLDPVEEELELGFDAADDWCGEVQLEMWVQNTRTRLISDGICRSSPLVLDLDGDGVHLGSLDQGVVFDLLGTGEPVRTAWPAAEDAFLALDRNGNGVVDDATELFGSATAGRAFEDGFRALASHDDDGDRRIDARDAVFTSLRLWRDADRNGVCTANEMTSLADARIRRLDLAARSVDGLDAIDPHGNRIPLVSTFERASGREGALVDVWLRFRPLAATQLACL